MLSWQGDELRGSNTSLDSSYCLSLSVCAGLISGPDSIQIEPKRRIQIESKSKTLES